MLTDPIANCWAIHRLLTVVSRRNRRAILTFLTSPLRRYNMKGDSKTLLTDSMAAWRELNGYQQRLP